MRGLIREAADRGPLLLWLSRQTLAQQGNDLSGGADVVVEDGKASSPMRTGPIDLID